MSSTRGEDRARGRLAWRVSTDIRGSRCSRRMTEAAYEEYEDSHDHDDDDDDEMEEAIAESVVVSQAKTTDETTVTTTATTTSTEIVKTTSSTIGATRVGELARGLVSDTETKVIYAGGDRRRAPGGKEFRWR